jgi:hypothetical protein
MLLPFIGFGGIPVSSITLIFDRAVDLLKSSNSLLFLNRTIIQDLWQRFDMKKTKTSFWAIILV